MDTLGIHKKCPLYTGVHYTEGRTCGHHYDIDNLLESEWELLDVNGNTTHSSIYTFLFALRYLA